MDFWSTYKKKKGKTDFSTKQLWLNTGDRYNTSIARLEDRSVELKPGGSLSLEYSPEKRYLVAKNITFDLFISFYDVNSKVIVAARPTMPMNKSELARFRGLVKKVKKANLEARIIGQQNEQVEFEPTIEEVRKMTNSTLAEVDLFGNQARHLIIDLLTGKPYSLLLENRIYRPGELLNSLSPDVFDSSRSKLEFG